MRASSAICLFFLCATACAQQAATPSAPETSARWTIGLSFLNEANLGGYTQVREKTFVGDKLDLRRDLGMDQWSSLAISGEYRLPNSASLSLSVEDFFFTGHAIVYKNIWFNGVHESGFDGLSPSRTELYRVVFAWEKRIHPERMVYPSLCFGLVSDNLIFYVTGRILPDTWSVEQSENFALHMLPFPFVGAKLHCDVGAKSFLVVEASGTYIPDFKSSFHEGGPVWLHYWTMQAGVGYGLRIKRCTAQLSLQYRALRTLQESGEDTNDLFFQALGAKVCLERLF